MSAREFKNVVGSEPAIGGAAPEKLSQLLSIVSADPASGAGHGWKLRVGHAGVELFASLTSDSEESDPDGREPMIRSGDVLFRVKLALKCLGCLGPVELFPALDNLRLVARIHYGRRQWQDAGEMRLFATMMRSFEAVPPAGGLAGPSGFIESLRSAAGQDRAWLDFSIGEPSRSRLLACARQGAQSHSSRTVDRGGSASPTGRRTAAFNWPTFDKATASTGVDGMCERSTGSESWDHLAAVAALKTKTDDRYGWVAAGHASARIQLEAQACGVPVYYFGEAFRSRRLREELRTTIGRKGFVQAVVGFGSTGLPVKALAATRQMVGASP